MPTQKSRECEKMSKKVERRNLEVFEVGGFEVCIVTVPLKYDVEKNVQESRLGHADFCI